MSMRSFADFNGTPRWWPDEWLAPSPSPPGPQLLIDTTHTGVGTSTWPPLRTFHGHGHRGAELCVEIAFEVICAICVRDRHGCARRPVR